MVTKIHTEIKFGWDKKFQMFFIAITDLETNDTFLSYVQMHALEAFHKHIHEMINLHGNDNPLSDLK